MTNPAPRLVAAVLATLDALARPDCRSDLSEDAEDRAAFAELADDVRNAATPEQLDVALAEAWEACAFAD